MLAFGNDFSENANLYKLFLHFRRPNHFWVNDVTAKYTVQLHFFLLKIYSIKLKYTIYIKFLSSRPMCNHIHFF